MKTAWASIRISSQDQKDGMSPETQRAEIIEQAKKDADCNITKFFIDEAKSAYSDKEDIITDPEESWFVTRVKWNNRNEFKRMLLEIKKGNKPDIIYFYMLSRLARNLSFQTSIFHYLESKGIEARFVKDYKPTESEVANFLMKITLGMTNELSSLITQIGTNSAFKQKFNQGLFTKPFFGYDGIRETPKGVIIGFKIKQKEAEIIRQIFKHEVNGGTDKKGLCKRLGISTKVYSRVLERKEYTGIVINNGIEKEVPDLAIIDLKTWEAVNKS